MYLPRLDYVLQRLGPEHPGVDKALRELDAVCGDLIDFNTRAGAQIVVLSEYGIQAVSRPVHLNRRLREAGPIVVRVEQGRDVLDPGEGRAFAVADHQVAHIYINDQSQTGPGPQDRGGNAGCCRGARRTWQTCPPHRPPARR